MKLRKIYLLAAFVGAVECASGTMARASETLFEDDRWRAVSAKIVSQTSEIEGRFARKDYDYIVYLDNLLGIYVNTMTPKIDEWKKASDSRLLEALATIVSSGKLKKTLNPFLDQIFHSYIQEEKFQKAYGMECCFQTFRGQAHGFFNLDNFKEAIPLLSSLLKMYPAEDPQAGVLKAQDRFYLMTAYMKTGQYKQAEELSDDVRKFVEHQCDLTLNHLQLSICATSAFVAGNRAKAMDIIDQKIFMQNIPDEDYLVMNLLYKVMTGDENQTWKDRIDAFDQETKTMLLDDTKWLFDMITLADLNQRSEPILPEPSNPTEQLVRDTLLLEDEIRENFNEQKYDITAALLVRREDNIKALTRSLEFPEMAVLQEFIKSSLEDIKSSDDEMVYYDFFIKFEFCKYHEAVKMRDSVVASFLKNRDECDQRVLHHLILSIFMAQGLDKALEFLPTLEQHSGMDVETWVLSLFLKAKKRLSLDAYIDETVEKMRDAHLSEEKLSHITEWVERATELLKGADKDLFSRVLTWIDPVEYDKKVLAMEELAKALDASSVNNSSNNSSNKNKTLKSTHKVPVRRISAAELKLQEEKEKKERVKEQQRIAREAAQERKMEAERQKLEQEAFEKEQAKRAAMVLKREKKMAAMVLKCETEMMVREDELSRTVREAEQKKERIMKNLHTWGKTNRMHPMPQVSYKQSLSKPYHYLIEVMPKGSKELIFQKIKPFAQMDSWKERVSLQKQLRSSHLPKNSQSQALLGLLKAEHAVEYREISGTYYAIYKYNPSSVLYALDESIVPGTLGFTTKPLNPGDKLRFVPIVE